VTEARERHVRVGGLRIHVRELVPSATSNAGPPLLMLNGMSAPVEWWKTLEGRLDGMHLIQFDAPGVGRSQTPWMPVSVQTVAWMAAKVLDKVGVRQADVLGYSLGGMVAQQLAWQSRDRVRRIVLAATGPGFGAVPAQTLRLLNVATPLRYMNRGLYDRSAPNLFGGAARTDPEFLARQTARREASPPNKVGYLMQAMSLGGWSSVPLLSRVRQPVLVVTGDDDPMMLPVNSYILARRLPNARLVVAPGEGHLIMMDPASAALDPIAAFLQAHRLEDEPAWRDATVVDDALLHEALRSTRDASRPLRAAGAVWRRVWPSVGRPM
jgi:pimeloyl-ACP methyl ester carboxylesterase